MSITVESDVGGKNRTLKPVFYLVAAAEQPETWHWRNLLPQASTLKSAARGDRILVANFALLGETNIPGDVIGNGRVDIHDVIMLLRHIVGLESLDQEARARARVSSTEGEPDIGDVILILRHIVGLISKFPVEW